MGNNESACCQRPGANGSYYTDYDSTTPEVYTHARPKSRSNVKSATPGRELLLDSESDNHTKAFYKTPTHKNNDISVDIKSPANYSLKNNRYVAKLGGFAPNMTEGEKLEQLKYEEQERRRAKDAMLTLEAKSENNYRLESIAKMRADRQAEEQKRQQQYEARRKQSEDERRKMEADLIKNKLDFEERMKNLASPTTPAKRNSTTPITRSEHKKIQADVLSTQDIARRLNLISDKRTSFTIEEEIRISEIQRLKREGGLLNLEDELSSPTKPSLDRKFSKSNLDKLEELERAMANAERIASKAEQVDDDNFKVVRGNDIKKKLEEQKKLDEAERINLLRRQDTNKILSDKVKLAAEEKSKLESDLKTLSALEVKRQLDEFNVNRRVIVDEDEYSAYRKIAEAKKIAELEATIVDESKRIQMEKEQVKSQAISELEAFRLEDEENLRRDRERLAAIEAAKRKVAEDSRQQAEFELKLQEEKSVRLRAESETEEARKRKMENEAKLIANSDAKLGAAENSRINAFAEIRLKAEAELKKQVDKELQKKVVADARKQAAAEALTHGRSVEEVVGVKEMSNSSTDKSKLINDNSDDVIKLDAEFKRRTDEEIKNRLAAREVAREVISMAASNGLNQTDDEIKKRAEEGFRILEEAEAKAKMEAEKKLRQEEEARIKAEDIAKAKTAEAVRLKAESEAQVKAELEKRKLAEEAARREAEEEEEYRIKREAQAKIIEEKKQNSSVSRKKAELDAKKKAESEARRKAALDAMKQADNSVKEQEEFVTKSAADVEAMKKREEEAKVKALLDLKRKTENDKKRALDEENARIEKETEIKLAEENRIKAEIEAKQKIEEAKQKADAEARIKVKNEAKRKQEEEAKREAEELEVKRKIEEEEARRLALIKEEEDAFLRVREEAKRKAEEIARRLAEEEEAIRLEEEERLNAIENAKKKEEAAKAEALKNIAEAKKKAEENKKKEKMEARRLALLQANKKAAEQEGNSDQAFTKLNVEDVSETQFGHMTLSRSTITSVSGTPRNAPTNRYFTPPPEEEITFDKDPTVFDGADIPPPSRRKPNAGPQIPNLMAGVLNASLKSTKAFL